MNIIKLSCSIFGAGALLWLLSLSGCEPTDSVCEKISCPQGSVKKEVSGKCVCESEYPEGTVAKTGHIKAAETWSSDTIYVLEGKVIVDGGVTLTIQPGTIIKGAAGTGTLASALLVAQNGKLNACGTAKSPIIMTSVSDNIKIGEQAGTNLDENQRGLWGGLIVLGNAPGSFEGDVKVFQIEGIPADDVFGLYGGTKPDDNSGSLCYISIRHGGASIGSDNEINGLTLGGVGSGTKVDHIEVVGNLDDGIEFFGGTVNVTDAIVWAQGDDAFDVDQAYAGTLRNFVYIAGVASDHGLEIDGSEGSATGSFTLEKGTLKLIGTDKASKGVEIADFRDKSMGTVTNLRITNLSDKSDVEIDDTVSMNHYLSGSLVMTDWQFVTTNKSVEELSVYDYYKKLQAKEAKGESVDADEKARASQNSENFKQKMAQDNATAATLTGGADVKEFSWTFTAKKGALDF